MQKRKSPIGLLMITSLMAILATSGPRTASADSLKPYLPQIKETGGWYLTESAVVSGSDVRSGIVYAVFDYPAEALVAVLRDYGSYKDLMPFLNRSDVLNREPNGQVNVRLKAKILKGAIKLKATVTGKEYKNENGQQVFTVKKTSGNLKRLDAKFTVEPVTPQKTIVRIELMLDPDVWYVRDDTLSEYNQVNARRIARALKKQGASHLPTEAPSVEPSTPSAPNTELIPPSPSDKPSSEITEPTSVDKL